MLRFATRVDLEPEGFMTAWQRETAERVVSGTRHAWETVAHHRLAGRRLGNRATVPHFSK